jgi:hypothetical protein
MIHSCEECKKTIDLHEELCLECALTMAQMPGNLPGRTFTEAEKPHSDLTLGHMLKMMIRHGGFSIFLIKGIKPKILLLDTGITGPVPIAPESLTTGDCISLLYPLLSKKEIKKLAKGSFIEVPLTFDRHLFSVEISIRNDSPEALITAEAPLKQRSKSPKQKQPAAS